jgi:hypothetical protein
MAKIKKAVSGFAHLGHVPDFGIISGPPSFHKIRFYYTTKALALQQIFCFAFFLDRTAEKYYNKG